MSYAEAKEIALLRLELRACWARADRIGGHASAMRLAQVAGNDNELVAEARRWAAMILACSPMSVRATKQVVQRSRDVPSLEMAMRNTDYPAFLAMSQSEDTVEGPRAFAEERKPQWKGR